MAFNFRIAFFHLPFLEIIEGRNTDSFCWAMSYISLKNGIILPFSQSRNSREDELVVYICGPERDTK